jgi:arginase
VTGYFDGTPLATLTGACWETLRRSIPGFVPIPERRVVLVGVRDVDPLESDRLRQSAVTVIPPDALKGTGVEQALAEPLLRLRSEAAGFYLHVDLDALDPSVGRANRLAVPDGLTVEAIAEAIRQVGAQIPLRGAAFTAYDPSFDPDGAVVRAAIQLIAVVAETVEASSP